MKTEFTKTEQRHNLLKLALGLITDTEQERFSMREFLEVDDFATGGPTCHLITPECNTVGCAAGNGPRLTGIKGRNDETWFGYIKRVFGLGSCDVAWAWCFSMEWAKIDNTPQGAGKRILWYLMNGVPTGFSEGWMLSETKTKSQRDAFYAYMKIGL